MTTKQNYLHSFVSGQSLIYIILQGAIAGICAKTVIAPIERIKIIFLTRARSFTYAECYQEFRYVYQNHGLLNFWRGNSANLLRITPQAAIRFAGDANNNSLNRRARLFFCGSLAGIIGQTITYPFDFLRTRLAMQRDHFSYSNIFHAFKSIYRDEGPRAFYSGVGIGIIGVSLYHGMGFFFFTLQKETVIKKYPHLKESKLVDFTLGGLGSVCAQIISYPFDIVKKRMQGQRVLLQTKEIKEMIGVIKMILHVHNSEGVFKGFYKGVSLNFIKAPISSGTAWTIKNAINRHLDKKYDL